MNLKIFILLGLSSLLLLQSRAQHQAIMTKNKLQLPKNQASIHYVQQGQRGINLLFLHGWCINHEYWKEQIDHFAKNYTVYALDLPGFGNSTAERDNWTIEAYAEDVNAFIDELGLKQVVLIGHSMSGAVMLQAALNRPDQMHALIGVDNFKFIDVEFSPEQMEEMTAFFPLLEKDFKHAAPAYAENMLFHSSTPTQIKERIKTDFAQTDPTIGYSSFTNLMQYSSLSSQKLDQLNQKLYLVNSDAIPTNIQGLRDHCKKGFVVKEVGATGHYPMVEKAEEFNQRLGEILKMFQKGNH